LVSSKCTADENLKNRILIFEKLKFKFPI